MTERQKVETMFSALRKMAGGPDKVPDKLIDDVLKEDPDGVK